LRSPLSLERARYDEDSGEVRYRHKGGHDADEREDCVSLEEKLDPLGFLARILVHVPFSQHGPSRPGESRLHRAKRT